MDDLVEWFKRRGGSIDESAMGFTVFPADGGRGAVALGDIPEGHALFTLPRSLTLSTRTSSLPLRIPEEWKKYELGKGWVGLILCMMWEEAQPDSLWAEYLASLPDVFSTPMFWSEEELSELNATAIIDKIGKDEAEKEYHNKLLPTVRSRPDIFQPEAIESTYSLRRFHIMGSRILSRCFTVEKWSGDEDHDAEDAQTEEEAEHAEAGDASFVSSDAGGTQSGQNNMDVDEEPAAGPVLGDAEDSEDEDDSGDVAMVPMADMLNARYGSENAKLFYESRDLRMVTTKPIASGEQIWNTYGDPPNSDLLRRYGHVDLLALSDGDGMGNPSDIVEVRADLVLNHVNSKKQSHELEERIDWWLEEGGDDVFVFTRDAELPSELVSLIRLLILPPTEWTKTRDKGKLPKGKVDDVRILHVVTGALHERLQQYPTSIEDDEALLATALSENKRQAVIVRLAEKHILRKALHHVETLVGQMTRKPPSGMLKRSAGKNGTEKQSKKVKHR
ncbi:SET domain-containing protein [Punctularia strigosozonata HHB-11173 SS5]|uniref:SET domain-containing protein n=1 Tax=Punctularia strigosozonata (strain HHB-11173) TaxID=741275 RepID=UPI0004416663|nr:SET domain-containing protein [Punctularia strigosozonata HHB-11173 SS5]EIN11537.1 SET domain-containing protein [Punctularia strigosozonata HHB-11173 SS5]